MAPVIGLTTSGRDERGAHSLPAAYAEAVVRAGGVPVLLPPVGDATAALAAALDGLLLTGGGDLDPTLYGEAAHGSVYSVNPARDGIEVALARHAAQAGLPCLCICRGAQVLNVALGGSLVQHLPERVGDGLAHRVPPRRHAFHEVRVEPDTLLARVVGAGATLGASSHHQAVDRVGRGLRVNARAADGTVEGVELEGHPWLLAVQWHPELTAASDPRQQALFDGLVAAALGAPERRRS